MCDDVVSHPHGVSDAYVIDPTACLLYCERTGDPVTLFLKRSRRWSQRSGTRKFVALMRKTAQDGRL